jgi:hypothetical protein
MRSALLEDRLQLSRSNLPETVHRLEQDYDNYFALLLEGMADRLEGHAVPPLNVSAPVEPLEQALNACCLGDSPSLAAARVESIIALLRATHILATTLDKQIVA